MAEDDRSIRRARRCSTRGSGGSAASRGSAAGRSRRLVVARRTAAPRIRTAASARRSAEGRLKKFRRGSALAVAITGLVLLFTGTPEGVPAQEAPTDTLLVEVPDTVGAADSAAVDSARADPGRSVEEATSMVRQFVLDLTELLPKILIALGLLLAAAIIVRVARAVLRRVLGEWQRADAVTAVAGILIWLLAFGLALSVIAGDTRTLLGSVGLFGLALSWALQAPIESFAGWLLNSFKSYYRVGDRIAVGEVFGDVYRIDFMNTTVWEAGGPDKPVQGAQPTGALITFPNSEVLRANIINYTRGFPYVWDEISVGIANESDIGHAMRVIAAVARDTIGPAMSGPAEAYRALLVQEGLDFDVADEPQVYIAPTESWTDVIVRYLVNARERRKWASALHLRIGEELAKPENRERIRTSYPVRRLVDGSLEPASD